MHKKLHAAKHLLHKATPKHIMHRHSTSRLIRKFADDIGLVYFGYVDQNDDEHQLMRGITMSMSHDDHYYSVGTFHGYDMALTVRRDTLQYPDRRLRDHHWTIMTFDLHTHFELPHLYIGHHTIRDELLARYTELGALNFGSYARHSEAFLSNYTVYGRMTHAQIIELLLTPEITHAISDRFLDVSIEIHDNTIYLYKPEKHPTRILLERMASNGIWLAESIDERLLKR